MKPVAVIILNWNGEKLLERFLPSVVAHTRAGIADVIVADNGSTDGSRRLLASRFPGVRIILFDSNLGFAGGYNEAVRRTAYRYTVLLNSDVEVKDDWLPPLLDYMETHPDVAAAQPKVLSVERPSMFEYAGAAGGFLDRNGYPYCRGRIFDTVEADTGQYDTVMPVHWATGAALMVRTECYLDAGGLDPLFFAHMEEIDLCWRLRLAGFSVVAIPQSRVWHLGGGSLPASSPRKTYLNFRNSLLMLHKNLPVADRRGALLRRRLLDTLAWGRFVASLDFANAGAILKAHRDYRRMAAADYGSITSPGRNLLRESPQSRTDILTSYFLRGIRTYAALEEHIS